MTLTWCATAVLLSLSNPFLWAEELGEIERLLSEESMDEMALRYSPSSPLLGEQTIPEDFNEPDTEDILVIMDLLDVMDRLDRPIRMREYHHPSHFRAREEEGLGEHLFYGYLETGTVIYYKSHTSKRPKKFSLPRPLYVRFKTKDQLSRRVWILDNQDRLLYWAKDFHVVDVTRDFMLTPRHSPKESYPPPQRFYANNPTFHLRHELGLGVYQLRNKNIQRNFNQDLSTPRGDFIDYAIYMRWGLPLYPGFTFRYEGAASESNEDRLSWQAFSLGPKFLSRIWSGEKHQAHLALEVTQGFLEGDYNGTEGLEGDFLRLGLEGRLTREIRWGELFLSLRWFKERTTLDRETRDQINPPAEGRKASGFMLLFGVALEHQIRERKF